ncbi:MAG: hypothetical protein K2O31_03355 [Clostridia bacterium]|nr:hypothetical protein [Clostridia bacterium]
MRSKRKSITTNLIAVIVLLVISLCLVFGATYTAECSEEQISNNAEIVTTSNSYEDFSSYTNQELPDKIDRNNIKQYVPIDKFNKNGTTIYNGRNYGFIIYSNSNTNHVLLFKEEYVTHQDGDGYEVVLKVVYENSFFKSGNNILNANSPYHIALADIKFDNTIFDADMYNNVAYQGYDREKDTGAYYTQVRYENQFSYYDGRLAVDTCLAVTSFIGDLLGCFKQTEKVGEWINWGCSVISNGLLIYDISQTDRLWVENTNFDTDIDFPLSRNGQLAKYGALTKNVNIDVQANEKEYLSNDNGGGFAKAIFRVMNDNNKDYYISNRISFEVCRYNGAQRHVVDTGSIESVYSVTGTDCNRYGQVTEEDEKFEYENYQRFAPMAKTNLFNFVPAQQGEYSIFVPNGYYLSVNGKAQSSNRITVNSSGCKVGIASSLGMAMGDKLYARMLPEDFYNGEIAFTNIAIQKNQQLNINEPTQVGEIAYEVESSNTARNDVYILDAGDNAEFIDLYVTDGDLNVLAKAAKKDGKLYVNYPMKANEVYGVVCVNRTGIAQDLTVEKQSGMTVENYPYSDIPGLYYSYSPRYTQFYNAANAMLYDENMDIYPSNNAFLQANETYFLQSQSQGNMSMSLSEQTLFAYLNIGEELTTQNTFNEMFKFTPAVTALYKFDDGAYDVYDGDTLVAQGVNQCVLQNDTTYRIVKRQFGGVIKVYLDGDTLSLGTNNINAASPYSVFKLNIEERSRLDININNANSLAIYDSAFNEIQLDHGYLLEASEYYIIVKDSGAYNITIEEYLQQVDVTFKIDGEVYNDTTGAKYYYGKIAHLPVPAKDRYNFNGWLHNGILITDNNGVTCKELLEDEMTLVADWTMRGVVIQINFSQHTAVWWNGSEIVDKNEGAIKDDCDSVIDKLMNLKDDFEKFEGGKKQGHFLKTFKYKKVSSVGDVDYYEFTPVWEVEKYYIEFITPYSQTYTTTRAVSFGEIISSSVFPAQAFQFDKNQQLYNLIGWTSIENPSVTQFAIGMTVPDLTPGNGSKYEYDSDGDGKKDSRVISLKAVVEYVDYTIRINSTSYRVPQEGYNVWDLGSYGYKESNYYGHNVLLTTPKKDKFFSFGGVINISDLTSYWTSGSRSVTVDMSLVDNYIPVALSYSHSGSGNPTSYSGNQGNITLKSTYVRAYKFVNWTLNGNEIAALNYANLGINQYYSEVRGVTLSKTLKADLTRTTIKPYSATFKTISDEVVFVDLSRSSIMTGITFTISSSVKEVTFANGYCRDSIIKVDKESNKDSRSSKLVINFQNARISARSKESAIDASLCEDLELYSFDSRTELKGGEASLWEGGAAITCRNLTLLGETFNIIGGATISINFNARAGIYGVGNSSNKLVISAKNVVVTGGSGEYGKAKKDRPSDDEFDKASQGKDGANGTVGKTGANGAVAIYFLGKVVISNGCNLTCTGGAGGYGGQGSDGQRGGDGKNGVFLGPSTVKPGNGGNGGRGGTGGNGAKPIIYGTFENGGSYTFNNGAAGEGGYGGYGAAAGASSHNWDSSQTFYGTPGTDGAEGLKGRAGASTAA